MTPAIAEQIESLPASVLTPIVRNVLGDDTAKITGSWTAQSIGAVHNDLRTEAILKVSGQAQTGNTDGTHDWCVILKVMRDVPLLNSAAMQVSPASELALYKSGVLDGNSSGLKPARCYGWDERADDVIWLWLEDLTGAYQPPWTPDQHFFAARDAGRLNGTWPTGLDRDAEWLGRDIGLLRWSPDPAKWDTLRERVDLPTVLAAFPRPLLDRVLALEHTIGKLSTLSHSLPRCFSHGDCHGRNLFLPDPAAERSHTIAVDWAGVGTDLLGVDGGTLAGASLTWGVDEAAQTLEIEQEIFENYLIGLSEAGWSGKRSTVHAGYLWSVINYIGAVALIGTSIAAGGPGDYSDRLDFVEGRLGRPYREIPTSLGAIFEQCLPIIDQADALLDELGV